MKHDSTEQVAKQDSAKLGSVTAILAGVILFAAVLSYLLWPQEMQGSVPIPDYLMNSNCSGLRESIGWQVNLDFKVHSLNPCCFIRDQIPQFHVCNGEYCNGPGDFGSANIFAWWGSG